MANYCSNSIAIFGCDKEKVDELHNLMAKFFQENSNSSIRAFAVVCGYSSDEAFKMADGRDTFADVDNEVSEIERIFYFKFQTESAWNPNVDVFRKIISDKYGEELDMEYCSEEPGMGIFINTDEEGLFFTDRYYLNSCINSEYETEYFESKQELLDWIKSKFPDIKATIKTAWYKIEEEVCDHLDESGDDFFVLHKFSCD
ncbi:MAG: hypothetical protein IJ963_04085 [Phascolarctobacterium sp.]|nr:hypothetical protein [Phascolarctobacterium sp.]